MPAIAAAGPSPFWFLTRGTGVISLLLLTLTVALGIANVRRTQIGEMPRFVLDSIHRTAALLAVSFVGVHIVTTLLDGFAPITLLDTVIPFTSAYRPVWLGLGAVAFDLLLAVIITSLLRRRLGYGAWRAIHWLAYASWPVALIHGLGTGTDAKTHWMLLLTAGCVAVVLAAVVVRVSDGWPEHLATRLSALGVAALLPLGLLAWLPSGPLAAGWAKRAGTPASVLAQSHAAGSTATASNTGTTTHQSASSSTAGGAHAFTAPASGRVRQSQLPDGLMLVDISLGLHGQSLSHLRIRIRGRPITGGGVEMTSSRVTLGPVSNLAQYSGRITGLQGSDITAAVSGGGSTLSLLVRLQISPGPGTATGVVSASPGGGQ
jgi:methionine sulfoxide reductase heme-binding subunit